MFCKTGQRSESIDLTLSLSYPNSCKHAIHNEISVEAIIGGRRTEVGSKNLLTTLKC